MCFGVATKEGGGGWGGAERPQTKQPLSN